MMIVQLKSESMSSAQIVPMPSFVAFLSANQNALVAKMGWSGNMINVFSYSVMRVCLPALNRFRAAKDIQIGRKGPSAVSGAVVCRRYNLANDNIVVNLPQQMLRTVVGNETIWRQYIKSERHFGTKGGMKAGFSGGKCPQKG